MDSLTLCFFCVLYSLSPLLNSLVTSCLFSILKGKPDLNTSLPVRQTASIFKQPVTKVTNHPSNKVKTDPQKAVDQPRQVSSHCEPPPQQWNTLPP